MLSETPHSRTESKSNARYECPRNHAVNPVHDGCSSNTDTSVSGLVAMRACAVEYAYPHAEKSVFKNISVDAKRGSVLAILGNNGAGKSTLLNLLAGIAPAKSGQILLGEQPLAQLSRREVARHVAYVTQRQNIPHMSVYDSVMMGRKPHVTWSLSDYDRHVVASVIDQMGLADLSQRYLDELSGGQRQKVYLARALAQETKVLLLDEPTSALDPKNQIEVLTAIRSATQENSLATVMVIHDINLALRFCDCFLFVRNGIVVAQGGFEVITEEILFATYDIPFRVCEVEGALVALPL